MVIHGSKVVAVHAHPLPAVTFILPEPPDEGYVALVGEIVQPASWITLNPSPLSRVIDPHLSPQALAATE
jgi:hypothetical protein